MFRSPILSIPLWKRSVHGLSQLVHWLRGDLTHTRARMHTYHVKMYLSASHIRWNKYILILTFSPFQENLSREANYNPMFLYKVGVEQRLLRMEVEGVRASSHCREDFSSGLCYWQCTLWTPLFSTVLGRALTKFMPLAFFCFPFPFGLTDSFFL